MKQWAVRRWRRLAFAGAAGAGLGCFLAWAANWFLFISGNLQGPDFFSFYAAAEIYVQRGPSAVYDILVQKQYELAITHQGAETFIVLPYFHPPYYTLLIAPLAALSYRAAYYAMTAFNVLLGIALITILVRGSLRVHGKAVIVGASLIAGFLPLFVTVLQGQSDLVVLVPLAAAYTAWARGRLGWAVGGSLPTHGQVVYTDTAVYSLRHILEILPGGGKIVAFVILVILLALVALSLSWRPDKPRLDFALAVAASLVLSPHQNVHDLALLVIPGFALADLAYSGELRWPGMAGLVLGLAYAAINLSLATSLWAAAGGALAIAAFLTLERMAVRPDPLALTELRWQGPRPNRVIVLPAYRAAKTLAEVVGDIPKGHADRILLVDDASADATVSVATALHLDVIRHTRNLGYGGNRKPANSRAFKMAAQVAARLPPADQQAPRTIPHGVGGN